MVQVGAETELLSAGDAALAPAGVIHRTDDNSAVVSAIWRRGDIPILAVTGRPSAARR